MNNPEPVQPAVESTRAASDIYDPDDGVSPYTLTETAAAGEQARQALETFLEALRGCRTPLNLQPTEHDVRQVLDHLRQVTRPLTTAAGHIADESLLAAQMPDGENWQDPVNGYQQTLLTPAQIVMLTRRAEAEPDALTVTYLEHLLEHRPMPSIPYVEKMRVVWEEHRAQKREIWNLQQRILDDIDTRACPSCEAEAGSECVTRNGMKTSAPHAARRHLSPMAEANPKIAAKAFRPHRGARHGD